MQRANREIRTIHILMCVATFLSIGLGITLGISLAGIKNYENLGTIDATQSALPTRIYDTNNNLITELFQDEKREIVPLEEIPQHLINAVLTREDQKFYKHIGFSLKGLTRATFGYIFGRFLGGGSTLTMQVAGNKYDDRTDISIRRKLVEIWYALQLEKHYTKNEILEFYLNEMPFGSGTNGVEAASEYYFRKSVRDITLAESVILINILSSHTTYSPLKNPEESRKRQRQILDEMVKLGYATEDEADLSFQEYWDNYDFTRYGNIGAWSERENKAPWFSEYIRQELEDMLVGPQDIYRMGLQVYTTLDLDYQQIADEVMVVAIPDINRRYKEESKTRINFGDDSFIPIVDILSLTFNLEDIRIAGSKKRSKAEDIFHSELNPVMDLASILFNIEELKKPADVSFRKQLQEEKKTEVEGALVCIEPATGHILAVVGGREFSSANQFNRAFRGGLQPGSAFKPLYYSAAISSGIVTTATRLTDRPTFFTNPDGTPYTALNYMGRWRGSVLLRYALAHSMNVPSLKVFERVGFDAAIERASRMLGITDPADIEQNFPRVMPLGLGICSVSPLQMARAFATFPNQGREVEPLAIKYILDRNGKVIAEPEKEVMARRKRADAQIMSPQTAYIVTTILRSVVKWGTLAHGRWKVGGFDGRPMAGKTGTPDNWGDAWAVGFTPQMVTAVWFGFDQPGNSLGLNLTGATAAGPVWARFMKRAHEGLPIENFPEPLDGITRVTICGDSGLLPDPEGRCGDNTYEEVFLTGTEPKEFCDLHQRKEENEGEFIGNLKNNLMGMSLEIDEPTTFSFGEEESFSLMENTISDSSSEEANPLLQ